MINNYMIIAMCVVSGRSFNYREKTKQKLKKKRCVSGDRTTNLSINSRSALTDCATRGVDSDRTLFT